MILQLHRLLCPRKHSCRPDSHVTRTNYDKRLSIKYASSGVSKPTVALSISTNYLQRYAIIMWAILLATYRHWAPRRMVSASIVDKCGDNVTLSLILVEVHESQLTRWSRTWYPTCLASSQFPPYTRWDMRDAKRFEVSLLHARRGTSV